MEGKQRFSKENQNNLAIKKKAVHFKRLPFL